MSHLVITHFTFCQDIRMNLNLILFVLLSIITQTIDGKLPDLATLCPYNDFCTTKATKTLLANETYLMPCCQKCSCEPDCQLFGNCCPDKELKPDVQVKYPCVSLEDYYNKPRKIFINPTYDVYFYVINDCPTRELLDQYPRCLIFQDISDYAFVSDPQTGRVYKNKHCAMCNGVTNYTEWLLLTNCILEDVVTPDEWFSYLYEECEITSIPPDQTSGHASRCYPPNLNDKLTCNSAFALNISDAEILDACEFSNSQINFKFYQDRPFYMLDAYQTPYCKLCNDPHGEEWSDLCRQLIPPFGDSLVFTPDAFSVLLNFFDEEEILVESTPQCNRTELWDPFQKTCLVVTCPIYSILLGGKCHDMYRRLPGAAYDIFFKVDIDFRDFDKLNIQDIHQVISKAMSDEHCQHCQTSLDSDIGFFLYLRYKLRTRGNCSEEYLIRQVRQMIGDPPVYAFSKKISIPLVPDSRISGSELIVNWASKDSLFCENDVELNHNYLDRCPRMSIDHLELILKDHDCIDIETENNGTMCVGEYFRIMQSLNGSNYNKQYHWVIIVVFLLRIM